MGTGKYISCEVDYSPLQLVAVIESIFKEDFRKILWPMTLFIVRHLLYRNIHSIIEFLSSHDRCRSAISEIAGRPKIGY